MIYGKEKQYRYIGLHKPSLAPSKCAEISGSVPFPKNERENRDLYNFVVNDSGLPDIVLDGSDWGFILQQSLLFKLLVKFFRELKKHFTIFL